MQFAVILHECFKCHACYSTSIKVGWKANTLSTKKKKSFTLVHLESNTLKLLPFTYACTHTYRKHTVTTITAHMLDRIQTNAQSITYAHMQSHSGLFFVSLSLPWTGSLKSSFVRSLHVLALLIYRGSELALYDAHTHTHAHMLLFPHDTMCCDWQIDWPTDCGCGATWQVEIGKWEAHFSLPSAEQKIKAFSSTEAIGRGGAQVVQVLE